MLKAMVYENFVHFKDRFSLDFSKTKDKPYFFIGASSTGKTAVLELIRRCMKSKLNTSLTNRFDVTKTAYAFCQFEVKDDENIFEPDTLTGYIIEGKNFWPIEDQATAPQEEKIEKMEDLQREEADEKDGSESPSKKSKSSIKEDEDKQGEEREETNEEDIDEKEIRSTVKATFSIKSHGIRYI
ncbi:uncharacterized protein LOC134283158 [Saccostrea cucullata]|uniref:uncharacterized protein LOC134283158 n=1 Tax=Saccostrea cuccullata TaxID=36930 RepID=UPI002ED194EA